LPSPAEALTLELGTRLQSQLQVRVVGVPGVERDLTHAALVAQSGRSADVGVGYKAAVPVAGTGVGVPGVERETHAALVAQSGRSADVGVGYKAAVPVAGTGVGVPGVERDLTHAALVAQSGRSADVGVGYKAAVPVAGTGVGVPGVGDLTHAALVG
jgi:hypothetical protein